MLDFHGLTRRYGADRVAEVLGISQRSLIDVRRGKTPLTIDDFYELERAFPQFDCLGTIRRIGAVRETKNRSRKFRLKDYGNKKKRKYHYSKKSA
jgi:transcriptional regulator with XRE-family HTH domain